ncbi:MAG TPA: hypothetical protein VMZ74_14090 [Ramlibacter sp.]|nr:hypothetical protein [Ramlibacter sp.]
MGALLFAGSFYAPALRSLVTWFALAGTVVVLLYFVVRRAATAPELDKRDATLFPQSTMMDDLDRKEKGD